MLKRHLASFLLGLGAITPFVAQADQPAMRSQSQQKKMTPQFDMGDPIVAGQPGQAGYVPAAYNYPAGIRAPNQDWDMYFTGAFTWWKVTQDNMYTGIKTSATTFAGLNFTGATTTNLQNEVLVTTKPGYKPGFKVGLGWNTGSWDNWTLYGEYTWFHPGSGEDDGDDDCGECGCNPTVLIVPYCACLSNPGNTALSLESAWKPRLDILDVSVGRPAYQGKHVVFNPFFGLRALWIRQDFNITYDGINGSTVVIGQFFRQMHSKAWSLGPRLGVDGSWLFGAGFRMIGNASASLLYTRYTKLTYASNLAGSNGSSISQNLVQWKYAKSYGTVRPNVEIDAGFGWGMYIGDCMHFDLAATYDFHTFFAQNMLAVIDNESFRYLDTAPGNMYIHGLTIKARFDF